MVGNGAGKFEKNFTISVVFPCADAVQTPTTSVRFVRCVLIVVAL